MTPRVALLKRAPVESSALREHKCRADLDSRPGDALRKSFVERGIVGVQVAGPLPKKKRGAE